MNIVLIIKETQVTYLGNKVPRVQQIEMLIQNKTVCLMVMTNHKTLGKGLVKIRIGNNSYLFFFFIVLVFLPNRQMACRRLILLFSLSVM